MGTGRGGQHRCLRGACEPAAAAAAAKSLEPCPTLCIPTDGSPPARSEVLKVLWDV